MGHEVALNAGMGRKRMLHGAKKELHLGVRIDARLKKELQAEVDRIKEVAGGIEISMSNVARMLIEEALEHRRKGK